MGNRTVILILALGAFCLSTPAFAQTENFEGVVTYADGLSVGTGEDWTISLTENGNSFSGSRSLLYQGLTNSTANAEGYIRTQVFAVVPDATYDVSIEYKSNALTNGFSVGACLVKPDSNTATEAGNEYQSSGGTTWSTWTPLCSSREGATMVGTWGDDVWRTGTETIRSGSATEVTVCYFAVAGYGNLADTYFDNLSIVPAAPPPSAVRNWSLYR